MRRSRKHRAPKPQSIAYYIEKVIGYRTEYETTDQVKNGYPPVVAELLLSLLIEVRTFCMAGRVLIGTLIALVVKALFFR